ncbi:MAG: hypothetical protein LBF41_01220, partial [Deltaproteobacteria bacterium]|nr:hypothetical protein [Deltaproteobacteria bacterium]
ESVYDFGKTVVFGHTPVRDPFVFPGRVGLATEAVFGGPLTCLERQSEEDCLWIRGDFLESVYDFGKTVVFGHTPFREPFVFPGRVGLDTGAVFGGPLTCMELQSGRLITVA